MTSLSKHQKHPRSLEPIKDFGHQFLHAKNTKVIPNNTTQKKTHYDDVILTDITSHLDKRCIPNRNKSLNAKR